MDHVINCFRREFQTTIPGYEKLSAGSDLLSRTKIALLETLTYTENLPRSHSVWSPGYFDQHVNMARLTDCISFRLRHDEADFTARWAAIGCALRGHYDFGKEHFRHLLAHPSFDVAWPIYAAAFIQRDYGADDPLALASFLEELNLRAAAQPTIAAVLAGTDSYIDAFESELFDRACAAQNLAIALGINAA